MKLTNLFRFHAVLAFAYAVLLVLLPTLTVSLLAPTPLDPLGTDLTRILGAAILFVGWMAWGASGISDNATRRMIARGLLAYTALGAVIALIGQLAGHWGALGWSNVVVYLFVALGYFYFLFVKPE